MTAYSKYIPPLRFHALTGAYDTALRAMGLGESFRDAILGWLALEAGEDVLDLGAGTGTLTIRMAQAQPTAHITAVDIDDEALNRGRAKAAAAGVDIDWRKGRAEALPCADDSFDVVVSALVFHHLDRPGKEESACEVERVLRPGGRLLLVDFGPLPGHFGRIVNPLLAGLRLERSRDNFLGLLPKVLVAAGLVNVHTVGSHGGIVRAVSARKP